MSIPDIPVRCRNFTILLFLLFLATSNSYSQNIPLNAKKELLATNKQELTDSVSKQTAIDWPYVIGRQHFPAANKVNHPYFNSNEWIKGTLVYNGMTYPVEKLKYDIENDKLIDLMYTPDYKMNIIALDPNFIPEFYLSDRTFRYFQYLKNSHGSKLKDGYYEVVYDGKLKFLARHEKYPSIDDNSSYLNYKQSTDLYLLKDGKMIGVKNTAKLINLLKEKKKIVKKYIRDNQLRLSLSDYSSAVAILKFYENQ